MRDYDVIVVGGGGAGLCAAIEATKAGAKCIIVEADKKLGGATQFAAGVYHAAGTSVQRAAGIEDDNADDMFNYVMALNHWLLKPDIVRMICDNAAPTLEWLIELGNEFETKMLFQSGLDRVPRGHASKGGGASIAQVLANEAGALGIDTAFDTRVERLLVEGGRVAGIHARDTDLRAPTVILATGGFGNNPDLVKRLFPSVAQHGDWVWALHKDHPFILGDGLRMAEDLGAALTGFDSGTMLATPGFGKNIDYVLPPWSILVNEEGKRFMPEAVVHTICGFSICAQTNSHAYAIFDEAILANAAKDPKHLDYSSMGMVTIDWDEKTLRQKIAEGRIKQAPTIVELAKKCGVDPIAMEATVDIYNDEDVAAGTDTHFFKWARKLFPIATPPFYAVEIRPAIIGVTGAGLDIDRDCHVLDKHGRRIAGLYAAGEVTGVIQGKRYAAGGFSIASALTLGRHAGRRAAHAAKAERAQN